MPAVLWLDTETYSEVPISEGTYKYAANCEVDIVTWALDGGEVEVWDVASGAPVPQRLEAAFGDDDTVVISLNAMFDRNVLRLGNLRIDTPIPRWRCCMVKALTHGLPGGLEKLCEIFHLPLDMRKVTAGRKLMHLFCKPQRQKGGGTYRATRHTHPEKWAQYLEYARMDTVAMRAVWDKLPNWNYTGRELHLWHLDQVINDRGFNVDTAFANAAIRAIRREQTRIREEVRSQTGYDPETGAGVGSATQRDELLAHILAEHGVLLPDMRKATLERRLEDEALPEGVRELLRLRLAASSSSTAKYSSVMRGVSADGRARGTIQYSGAARTRRAAGRRFQPQNLPSRGLLPATEVEVGIQAMLADCEDLLFDNVMHLGVSAVRGIVHAPEGRKLCVADLAAIEGRVTAYLAGEAWKLEAYREYDTLLGADGNWYDGPTLRDAVLVGEPIAVELDEKGEPVRRGPDLYKLAYAKSFQADIASVTKPQRQIGKVQELMLGYQGSVGAWVTGAAAYGIDLTQLAEMVWPTLPPDEVEDAQGFYSWAIKHKLPMYGLTEKVYLTCLILTRLHRKANPATAALWGRLEGAAVDAIATPGTAFSAGDKLVVRRDGAWLRVLLPSGACLCYPAPRVDDKGKISYMGVNQYTHQWGRCYTYGGKLTENASQSLSRDVLYNGMFPAERAGYSIVLHVHDELVTEVPRDDRFSHRVLAAILSVPPAWAPDLPLAAAGFDADRYGKEG